jgi:hypothetical protein
MPLMDGILNFVEERDGYSAHSPLAGSLLLVTPERSPYALTQTGLHGRTAGHFMVGEGAVAIIRSTEPQMLTKAAHIDVLFRTLRLL